MNKLIPVVVVLLLLGVGGYLFMSSQKAKPPAIEQKTTATTQGTTQQGGNIFTSIQDALSKSISLKCDYPDPNGKGTITSYIKNGAVRVMSIAMGSQGNGSAIMKDNKMWIWDDVKKTGMMLTLNKPTGTNPSGVPQQDQREKVLADMEKYKNYCKTEVVADSLFIPPTDVQFTDLQNIMQNAGQGIKGVPTGMPIPTVNIPTQGQDQNQ